VEFLARTALVDESGQPLSSHVQQVLRDLAPRLQRYLPTITDEVLLTEILEEAGRKIRHHEESVGPIEKLHAYAWVTVKSVATSRMRRSSMRIAKATVELEDNDAAIGTLRASIGSAERIESDILLEQMLARMTPEEQMLCMWKKLGYSSRQIAREQGTSVERVNTFFFRLKRKIREILREPGAEVPALRAAQRSKTRTA
jgi:DNA-directed RNA polymerase specialized sigma24 family protein